ncbi:MAG TPA: hypothetical protein VMT93_03740 [Gemmatimonadaceae bacterium]|nr:hypothetical protein [Gemmatimonadaceae bacterium]
MATVTRAEKAAKTDKAPDRDASAGKAELHWAGRVPHLKPGTYKDGLPLHDVHYLGCKLILRSNKFDSRKALFDFGKVIKKPAKATGVRFSNEGFWETPLKIREVLFIDTKDYRLYNNGFIARRRIPYKDGFPVGDAEIVFKFRHPELQEAAETDVRPNIQGDYRIKFKAQALPLKTQLGGIRMLYSHNVQFPRSHMKEADVLNMDVLTQVFPVLEGLRKQPNERIELVSETIIEEVLQDIGMIDFGDGITAKTDVGLWRTRGEHRPLIGEWAFQIGFADRKDLSLDAMERAERFFTALQFAAAEWIALNATKTGVVYRLHGNPPTAHE